MSVSPAKFAKWSAPFPSAQGGPDSCTGMTRAGETSVQLNVNVWSTFLPAEFQNFRLPDSMGAAQWTDTVRWNKRLLYHMGDFAADPGPFVELYESQGRIQPTGEWLVQCQPTWTLAIFGHLASGSTLLAIANTTWIPEFDTDASRIFLTTNTNSLRTVGMIQKGSNPAYVIRWLTTRSRIEPVNSACGLPSSDISFFSKHAPGMGVSSSSSEPGGDEGGSA